MIICSSWRIDDIATSDLTMAGEFDVDGMIKLSAHFVVAAMKTLRESCVKSLMNSTGLSREEADIHVVNGFGMHMERAEIAIENVEGTHWQDERGEGDRDAGKGFPSRY